MEVLDISMDFVKKIRRIYKNWELSEDDKVTF